MLFSDYLCALFQWIDSSVLYNVSSLGNLLPLDHMLIMERSRLQQYGLWINIVIYLILVSISVCLLIRTQRGKHSRNMMLREVAAQLLVLVTASISTGLGLILQNREILIQV